MKIDVLRLKRVIGEAGYKGTTITKAAGLKSYDLYNIYKGKSASIVKLQRICEVLGKPIEYFLIDRTNKNSEGGTQTLKNFNIPLYRNAFDEVASACERHQLSINHNTFILITNEVYKHALESGEVVSQGFAEGMVYMYIKSTPLNNK